MAGCGVPRRLTDHAAIGRTGQRQDGTDQLLHSAEPDGPDAAHAGRAGRSRRAGDRTGTGYNAALLAHRLGDHHVTSIDIDPDLVEAARIAARGIGLAPHLVAGDGDQGVPDRAPFDRIIATCAVPMIPTRWVAQLADRGIIVADLRAATSSSLITLHRTAEGVAEGRFHPTPGYFMWLRPRADDPRRDEQESNFVYDQTARRHSTTWLDPTLLADPGLGFMVAASVPDLVQLVTFDDPPTYGLRARDGSWARVDTEGKNVVQSGQRSVWNEIEAAARRWEQLARPDPSRFGLTVTADNSQRVWLDDVDGYQVPAGHHHGRSRTPASVPWPR